MNIDKIKVGRDYMWVKELPNMYPLLVTDVDKENNLVRTIDYTDTVRDVAPEDLILE